MPEPRPLNAPQREIFRAELAREDLNCYAAVRMAREDVAVGHYDSALAGLNVEFDALRAHQTKILDLIEYQYPNRVS